MLIIYKLIFIASAIFILLLTFSNPIKAETVLFEDNFNDNSFNENLIIKNYALEEDGSYVNVVENLNVEESNEELRFSGIGIIDKVSIDNNTEVGNFGKSVFIKSNFSKNNDVKLQFDVNAIEGNNYVILTTLEFNKDNRIIFAIFNNSWATLQLDENNNFRALFEQYNYNFNQNINIQVKFNPTSRKVEGLINNALIIEETYNGDIDNMNIGIAGTVRWPNDIIDIRYDNLKITTENPYYVDLPISDIKQYDASWGNNEYDFASNWYPSNPSISRWGCAMTSAVMVLKYYGHNTDPNQLNIWLKSQKDGYTRNGGVMWPSISRWTKSNRQGKPILEFSYHNPSDAFITSEIDAERPPILKMQKANGNTHFIVAKGKNGNDYKINDPASNSEIVNLFSQAKIKWGENVKVGKFFPSTTNLSYIVLMIDDGFHFKVSSPSGEIVGDEFFFEEGPYSDTNNPGQDTGLDILNVFYYPQPNPNLYNVKVEGEGVYQLDYYLYDENGKVKVGNLFGVQDSSNTDLFDINFNDLDSENSTIPQFSFYSLQDNWQKLYYFGYIKNQGFYNAVNRLIENALKNKDKGRGGASNILLEIVLQKVKLFTPNLISESVSINFQKQIEILQSSL